MKQLIYPNRYKLFALLLLLDVLACKQWEYDEVDFLEISNIEISEVGSNSINLIGNVKGLNETIVTEHGHVLSVENENPDVDNHDFKTALGIRGGNGNFTSLVDGLTENSSYFSRAYALWEGKEYYSDPELVRTNVGISTDSIQYLAGKEAIAFGSISTLNSAVPISGITDTFGLLMKVLLPSMIKS